MSDLLVCAEYQSCLDMIKNIEAKTGKPLGFGPPSKAKCSCCDTDVALSPSGQDRLTKNPQTRIICGECHNLTYNPETCFISMNPEILNHADEHEAIKPILSRAQKEIDRMNSKFKGD